MTVENSSCLPEGKFSFEQRQSTRQAKEWRPCNISFPFAFENLSGNDLRQRPPHEGAALAWADELLPRDRAKKFEQGAVEVGISLFIGRFGRRNLASQLSSQVVQAGQIFLKCRQWAEEFEPLGVPSES